MATKKQKRAFGLARHIQFMAEERQRGLAAQKVDREHRAHKERKEWEDQHDKKHSWKNRVKECPLCQDMMKDNIKSATDNVKETTE